MRATIIIIALSTSLNISHADEVFITDPNEGMRFAYPQGDPTENPGVYSVIESHLIATDICEIHYHMLSPEEIRLGAYEYYIQEGLTYFLDPFSSHVGIIDEFEIHWECPRIFRTESESMTA